MEDFQKIISDKIKNIQQVILQNTIDLEDSIRSNVFSKFQSIKYKMLDAKEFKELMNVEGAPAFYSQFDNTVYIQNKGNEEVDETTLLHEILHALTSNAFDTNTLSNNASGFKTLKTYNINNSVLLSSQLRGINEAATQFFAEKFLNAKNTLFYPIEVHIFSLICDECGYDKLKNAYFSNNVAKLKNIIKEGFNLESEYLVDKLLTDLDVFGVIGNRSSVDYFKSLSLVKNCYSTLLQMKLCKMFAQNTNLSGKELISNFNVEEYLLQNVNLLFKDFFEDFICDIANNKKVFLILQDKFKDTLFYTKLSLRFADAIMNVDVDFIEENLKVFRNNALGILQQLCSENIYYKKGEKTDQYFQYSNSNLINMFLGTLHNLNDKIDLTNLSENDKYQFIALALFNRYEKAEELYTHFYPKDLVNFINSGVYDCDTFFNPKAMEYILENIKDVKPTLFTIKDFANAYKIAKNKNLSLEKTM